MFYPKNNEVYVQTITQTLIYIITLIHTKFYNKQGSANIRIMEQSTYNVYKWKSKRDRVAQNLQDQFIERETGVGFCSMLRFYYEPGGRGGGF